jgi:3-oxoacyl-[acyl-carrier-protein] synthase-1
MTPLPVSHYTITTALGRGRDANLRALQSGRTGLKPGRFETMDFDAWLGAVEGLEQSSLPAPLAAWECRNNRLSWLALQQDGLIDAVRALVRRVGAERVGVFVGTSTSGIHHTENAFASRDAAGALPAWFSYRHTQDTFSCADFVREALDLRGPAHSVSTACSSSAKVFAAAQRAIGAGLCDAALVGGVDSLCLTTLYGFRSLQLVAPDICRPADAARAGISIGEAAGFAILDPKSDADLALLGYGESSDAYHMSAPEPEGRGAMLSMQGALVRASVDASEVGYINLHGTGTPANDVAEDKAVCAVFGATTPASSTKGWTGHTLGAAGMVEAAISLLCLRGKWAPQSLNTRTKDPALRGNILLESQTLPLRRVLSNSFGFGGNNCSLLFGARP